MDKKLINLIKKTDKTKSTGLLKSQYDSSVNKQIQEKYKYGEENAILRKMLVILANKMKEQHPNLDLTEFEEYNAFVEECKAKIKKELEL